MRVKLFLVIFILFLILATTSGKGKKSKRKGKHDSKGVSKGKTGKLRIPKHLQDVHKVAGTVKSSSKDNKKKGKKTKEKSKRDSKSLIKENLEKLEIPKKLQNVPTIAGIAKTSPKDNRKDKDIKKNGDTKAYEREHPRKKRSKSKSKSKSKDKSKRKGKKSKHRKRKSSKPKSKSKSKSKQSGERKSGPEKKKSNPIRFTRLCEKQRREIKCGKDQVLRIQSTLYGRRRNKNYCRSRKNVDCSAKLANVILRGLCDGKNKCQLYSSNDVYKDPCPGVRKYLEVNYRCENVPKKPTIKPTAPTEDVPDRYVGCFEDRGSRILQDSNTDTKNTVKRCIDRCRKKGRKYAGVEYGSQCFCGNNPKKYPRKPEKECNRPCPGNKKEMCGGTWRISIYRTYGKTVKKADPCADRCHKNAICRKGKCKCKRGFYGDGIKQCEKSCLCMASGDPHYKTYDGSIIHFMGICKYTMTKSKDSNDECAFNVEVKNERRGGNTRVSFTKSVDVTMYGKTVRILPQRKVLISGRRRHLPIKENDGKLKVFQSGRFVQVWSSCGVKVKFDGHHAVSVIVPGKYRNAMEGLCGNCNGDRNDDFRTKEGKDVKKDKNRYSLVGDSFAVMDEDDETGKCITQESPPVTCDKKMSKLVSTNAYCGLIIDKKGAFKDCIRQFPDLAKQFFESCKFDICSIDKDAKLLSSEKCDSVEAFAEECEENGVSVKWRTSSFCPMKCEDPNMEYLSVGFACPATCLEPKATSCDLEPTEGCFCKKGFVMSDGKCVRQTECGCTDKNGEYYPIGARKDSGDCTSSYTCKQTKKGQKARFVKTASTRKCVKFASCRLNGDGERACVCNKGYTGDGYKKCERPDEDPYVGCFEDRGSRILQDFYHDNLNTVERCINTCRLKGRKYAGVEYGSQCLCGDNPKEYPERPKKECDRPCPGNVKQMCGGTWRISIYRTDFKKEKKSNNDPCAGKCHENAVCRKGRCKCNRGFSGDGIKQCEKSCLCMASGDPHYKTYDGSIIHFMGICKYTMTKSKDSNDECAFNVEVKNEHRGGNTRVSFTKSVDVTIYGKTVRILPQRKVLISGRRRHLPIKENEGKLKVFQSGRFVQVWSSCGVKVKFDGHHAVSVIVPGKYRNKMEGLCGNCNGDRNDDFRTKEGKDVKKDKNRYSLVGDSFAVIDQDDETGKCITQESPPVTCDNKMSKLVATNAYCGLIIDKKGAFKDCIRQFPDLAKQFFESCKFDICSIDKEERLLSTEKCDSVEAFAEECEENGVSVKWRTSSFCPMICEDPNMEYLSSGLACPATCLEPKPTSCDLEPTEGCFCKKGFVMSDGKCVRETECGCIDNNGEYFPIGAKKDSGDCSSSYMCKQVKKGQKPRLVRIPSKRKCAKFASCRLNEEGERACVCKKGYVGDGYTQCKKEKICGGIECHENARCRKNRCVCKRGFYGDGVRECEKSCLCMASGDPHYKTYDGNIIHFMGSCRYTLTKSTKNGDACAFNVEVKNEHRGQNTRVSYTRYVDVQIYGLSVRLLPKGKVLVNGKRKYLPIMENKGVFKVFKSGRYVQVWTGCGIKVNFDGRHSVSVVVPSKYENNMIGLCGNCNGNKIDDMSTKDGTDVSKMKNRYSLVGESFMVNDKNSPERCITVEAPPTSCSKKLEKSIPTLDFCGAILDKKGVFRECVEAFPELAQEFYDSCKFDVCSLEEDPTMFATAKCTSLEAFAEECAENGIALQWRSSKMCPMKCDDPNMEFLYNGPGCSPSCANPNPKQNCPLEPREGCFCKKGYVLSDGECVKETDCGCTNSHKDYFPIGTKFTTEDCRRTLECQRQKGKAPKFVEIAKQKKCNKKASCDYDENGEKKCLCKKGHFGDGIKSCKPLCRGKYKCHEKAFCRRGKCKCAQGYFGDGIKSCDRLCTCSASGDPHYRTYDGQMIHFMGNCKYTMTKSLVTNDKCSFNVEVKNEHRGSNRRVTYTRMVDLHIYNRTIRLAKDGKIYVDGERKVLPVYENDGEISIFPSGRFVQVVTACNVVLRYDGKSVVRVGVPYRYRGMMTGLCGNCNRKKDDYRTKEGKDVRRSKKKYSLIGRSYQVPDDSDKPQKSCNTEEDEVKCTRQMNKVASQIDHCGFMDFARRDKSPFKICLAIKRNFAIQMYESCKYDVCSYYNNEEERRNVVCRAFENLDAECVELGLSFNWRTDQFCPLKCGANQVYKSYMNGCPATCANPKAEENCPVKSTEGCACLPGFLLSGTECVKKEECGCRLKNGDYLPVNATKESSDCATTWVCTLTANGPQLLKARSGKRCHRNAECSRIDGVQQCVCMEGFFGDGIKQCNELCGGKYQCHEKARCIDGVCLCQQGLYGDGIKTCQDSCTCTGNGDPHYRTFDGQMIHFQGNCKYTLAEHVADDDCTFSVEVKNRRQNKNAKVSFTRIVDVKVPGTHVRLHQKRRLTVNNQNAFTPYTSEESKLHVANRGRFIVVTTACGLVVTFDGKHSISVTIPKSLGRSVHGICGNCDGRKNDMRTKNGKDVSKSKNKYSIIGDSYKVFDDLSKNSKKCKTKDVDFTCSTFWLRKIATNSYCGMIKDKNGPFAECIDADNNLSDQFFKSCQDDVCSFDSKDDVAREMACMALESFAETCLARGYGKVIWRSKDFCPLTCRKNEQYNPAIVDCQATCQHPEGPEICNVAPQEGCECKEGFVLSGNQCVREEDCGCWFKDEYYPINATGPLTNCDLIQTCVKVGGRNEMQIKQRVLNCHQYAQCRNWDGEYKCVCDIGYTGDGEKECTVSEEPEEESPGDSPPSGSPCTVTTTHSSCGSTTQLRGDCTFESDFVSKCTYSVTTQSRGGVIKASSIIKGKLVLLEAGKSVDECVQIQNQGPSVIIRDNVCERCTVDFVRNIVSGDTCSAPQ